MQNPNFSLIMDLSFFFHNHLLLHLQVSVSLVQSSDPPENHDELIELVACPETGFLHLFSQHQLQVKIIVWFHENILE